MGHYLSTAQSSVSLSSHVAISISKVIHLHIIRGGLNIGSKGNSQEERATVELPVPPQRDSL